MKKIYLVKIGIFLSIIIIPIINMNLKKDEISEIDNRKFIEASAILDGDITENIEKYLEDRIGFRTEMINIYTMGADILFGEMIHPSYQYGKSGYVFGKLSKEVEDKKFQEIYSDFILGFQKYCEDRNVGFLYVVEPKKESVYTEYLPEGYNFSNINKEYFIKLLNGKNINYMDNCEVLNKTKDEVLVFDKKFDAGHWNETGAMVGMSAILDRLNKLNPAVTKLDTNKFETVIHKNSTLPVSYFNIDEKTTHYNLIADKSKEVNIYKNNIKVSSQFKTFEHYINESNIYAPKILVFAGSYFNGKDKFLTESFSEYIKIHNYHNVINYKYYIDVFKPDLILFESTEYTHNNKYFPVDAMKKVIEGDLK